MALPKKKVSKARRDKRHTHQRLRRPPLSPCPQCLEPRAPHRICPKCGYYKGQPVVEIKAKE